MAAALCSDSIADILLRLPAKSLLRFRCLSSSICAEIDDPNFAKNHLNRSLNSRIGKKLLSTSIILGKDFYASDIDDGLREAIPLKRQFRYLRLEPSVCGLCNGLILFGFYTKSVFYAPKTLFLWNPSTRHYRIIPKCPVATTSEGIGLGFDSANDDYKIVFISDKSNGDHARFPVWIFSLKSNSWKKIQDEAPILPDFDSSGPGDVQSPFARFAGGALYWKREFEILGFDLANEMFFNIELNPNYSVAPWDVVVVDDNLYTTKLAADRRTQRFYKRVRDEGKGGGAGCWVEAFGVDEGEGVYHGGRGDELVSWPKAYAKAGDKILLSKEGYVSWYNLGKKTRQNVEIPGLSCEKFDYVYEIFQQSLVSLGNGSAFDGEAKEIMGERLAGASSRQFKFL